MKNLIPVLAVLFLATATDLSAQIADKVSSDTDRSVELAPAYRSYQPLLEKARSRGYEQVLKTYLGKAAFVQDDHSSLQSSFQRQLSPYSKTADLSQVSPLPNLRDDVFYDGHSSVQLAGGQTLVFYVEWTGEQLVVQMTMSTDNGGSWSSPVTIITDVTDVLVRAGVTGSGRIVVTAPRQSNIALAHSTNDGASWQSSSLAIASDSWGLDMKPTPGGGLIMTYGRFDPSAGVTRIWLRKSTDGISWGPELSVIAETNDFGIFDGTVGAVTDQDLLFIFVEFEWEVGQLHVTQISSSDGGSTWSVPGRIVVNQPDLCPLPALTQTPDGTMWLVGCLDGDIVYAKSTDGGANWLNETRWTQFAGDDFRPSVSSGPGSTPVVTFTSNRIFRNFGIWIADLGGADSNPAYLPPTVTLDWENAQSEVPHSRPLNVRFSAFDETGAAGVAAVDVFVTVGETTQGPFAAQDDGNSGDGAAGDGIWGATIPGQPLGTEFSYEATATDVDGATGFMGFSFLSRAIAFQNVGNLTAGMPGGSISSIVWPADSGDNYLYGGGLWVGQGGKVTENWMWETDPGVTATDGPVESDQDITTGLKVVDWIWPEGNAGVSVVQRSYQWAGTQAVGRENGMVLEYEVTNPGASISELFVGLVLDIDILPRFSEPMDDLIGYDPSRGLLYMYDSGTLCTSDPEIDCAPGHVGVAVLWDAGSAKTAGTVAPYTANSWDFSVSPWEILTSGVNSNFATQIPPEDDYRMVLAAQPFALGTGESRTVAFALVMGSNVGELAANLEALEDSYQSFVVSVDEPVDSTIPTDFALGQNYPNPFNPSTTISFSLPTSQDVELKIFNVLGEHVETLVSGNRPAGNYQVTWEAGSVASGMYFYRLTAGTEYSSTKSLVVLK